MESANRIVLFTGHRIDAPGRAEPRFPAQHEAAALRLIEAAVDDAIARAGDRPLLGISSCANGGDILFLETCQGRGIETEIYLAKDVPDFLADSVADGGPQWVERFHALIEARPTHVLAEDTTSDLDVYSRTNQWMLEAALADVPESATLIALWDGKAGDGPGGTQDMVERARSAGAQVVHLKSRDLLEASQEESSR